MVLNQRGLKDHCATTLARQTQTDIPTIILLSRHNKTRNYQQKSDFRNIFTPLHSVYHSNINTILVAVGVKLCPKGVSTRITYLLATSFAARLGDLLRPQRLKLRTSSFQIYVTTFYQRTTIQWTFQHSYTYFNQSQCHWLKNV